MPGRVVSGCWAATTLLFVAAVLLLTSGGGDAANSDFYDQKVRQLDETTSLYCNNSKDYSKARNDSTPVFWLLPNLTVLNESAERHTIENDKWTLTISYVTKDDLGQYHCMLRFQNESENWWYLMRLGLNAEGPYFEDLWDKYMWNTIIGICAGFGFLALAIGAILVWYFRWIDPDSIEDNSEPIAAYKHTADGFSNGVVGYTNDGYVTEQNEMKVQQQSPDVKHEDKAKINEISETPSWNKSSASDEESVTGF